MMKTFFIEKTKQTAEIWFDDNVNTLFMKGIMLPENPDEFFYDIFKYLNELKNSNTTKEISLDFDLTYTTSSSNKRIFDLLKRCKCLFTIKEIIWRYEKDDIDVMEHGQDFEELLKLNFTYIPY